MRVDHSDCIVLGVVVVAQRDLRIHPEREQQAAQQDGVLGRGTLAKRQKHFGVQQDVVFDAVHQCAPLGNQRHEPQTVQRGFQCARDHLGVERIHLLEYRPELPILHGLGPYL